MVDIRSMAAHHNPRAQVDEQETTIFDESHHEEPRVAALKQRILGLTENIQILIGQN